MIIDCRVKFYYEEKARPKLGRTYIDKASLHVYESDLLIIRGVLEIVGLSDVGDDMLYETVLVAKEFALTGNSIHHIGFLNVNYHYDESKNIVYTTTTRLNI